MSYEQTGRVCDVWIHRQPCTKELPVFLDVVEVHGAGGSHVRVLFAAAEHVRDRLPAAEQGVQRTSSLTNKTPSVLPRSRAARVVGDLKVCSKTLLAARVQLQLAILVLAFHAEQELADALFADRPGRGFVLRLLDVQFYYRFHVLFFFCGILRQGGLQMRQWKLKHECATYRRHTGLYARSRSRRHGRTQIWRSCSRVL